MEHYRREEDRELESHRCNLHNNYNEESKYFGHYFWTIFTIFLLQNLSIFLKTNVTIVFQNKLLNFDSKPTIFLKYLLRNNAENNLHETLITELELIRKE
jgi:hypothetical protein